MKSRNQVVITANYSNNPLTLTSPPSVNTQVGVSYAQSNTASGGSGGYTFSISSGRLPDGLTLSSSIGLVSGTPTTAGSFDYTVKVTDSSGATATQTLDGTIIQAYNAISFPALADTAFTSTPPSLGASASSGLAVSYASTTSEVCTVSGDAITFISAGLCKITASQGGNGNYAAATPVSRSFTITAGVNTITFPALADTAFTSTPPSLGASASSGLAVSYTSTTSAVCTVSGGAITFVSAGLCTITASQGGNTNYVAATPVSQSFTITAGVNTITFPALASTAFTSTPPSLRAIASSGLAVGYASTTSAVCTVSNSAITFVSAGLCTITASQGGNSNYVPATSVSQSFTINAGVNTITFPALANTAFTSTPPSLGASASSGLPVSYASTTPAVCTVSGGAITLVAIGTCTIKASQGGNSNYAAAAPVMQSFTVTAPALTTSVTTASVVGVVGTRLTAVVPVTASGGYRTVVYALSGATLPPGLVFSKASGSLSGAPTAPLTARVFTVTATDEASQSSSKTFTLTVNRAMARLSLTASALAPVFGAPDKFVATVSGGFHPTGTITFSAGGATLGSVGLGGGGASLSTSSLSVGAHTIVANYSGDANNAPLSATLAITVAMRRNPGTDPDNRELVSGQFGDAIRFGQAQTENLWDQLDEMHDDDSLGSSGDPGAGGARGRPAGLNRRLRRFVTDRFGGGVACPLRRATHDPLELGFGLGSALADANWRSRKQSHSQS